MTRGIPSSTDSIRLPQSRATPAYLQVKKFVKDHILNGQWIAGDPVPSETVLSAQFGLARMTVNRALRELADEGLIDRTRGSGSRVAHLHRIYSRLMLRDIHEEILERGHRHQTRVLLSQAEKADSVKAKDLGLRTGAKVFHTILVHSENEVPIQYEDRYVNPAVAPNYLTIDFSQTSPTHYLLIHAPISEATFQIESILPSREQARELSIKATQPCLMMLRKTISAGRAASIATLIYPGSRYSLSGKFQA